MTTRSSWNVAGRHGGELFVRRGVVLKPQPFFALVAAHHTLLEARVNKLDGELSGDRKCECANVQFSSSHWKLHHNHVLVGMFMVFSSRQKHFSFGHAPEFINLINEESSCFSADHELQYIALEALVTACLQ